MRTSRYLLSESFSPWMHGVAALARLIEPRRQPLPEGDADLCREREAIERASESIEDGRKQRDAAEEQIFRMLLRWSHVRRAGSATSRRGAS
ncbi:hypothetical protein PY365_27215 [Roseiarcaceae bacterium H3SJ34-1]|uniref:hypothetical protein n=1 Tax=Terripilifer ovatus TaxID=3032367 RepID=UPI003AB97A58|nr:hypothetical protein [Roseiarcaceae bacterium H3SJ34-1]